MCSFIQLIKSNTKGVALKVGIVVVKYQAAQYSRVGLAELLFRNISLLTEVRKDGQFKVKIIIFTAVFRLVGVELGQVSQLLTVDLCLGGLRIYDLWICGLWMYGLRMHSLRIYSLRIYSLNNKSNLVRILVYRGVIVYNLRVGCILANKVNSKAA